MCLFEEKLNSSCSRLLHGGYTSTRLSYDFAEKIPTGRQSVIAVAGVHSHVDAVSSGRSRIRFPGPATSKRVTTVRFFSSECQSRYQVMVYKSLVPNLPQHRSVGQSREGNTQKESTGETSIRSLLLSAAIEVLCFVPKQFFFLDPRAELREVEGRLPLRLRSSKKRCFNMLAHMIVALTLD